MQQAVTTTFDLYGTLVDVDRPGQPANAVASELRARDVPVPEDWRAAFTEPHRERENGREYSLAGHVAAALDSRGVDADTDAVRDATLAAYDRPVTLRDGAEAAVRAAREHGPVGVLSNCSVPGLVERTLARTSLPAFDAVVSSVDCGWRKPHPNAFEAAANALDAQPADLVHVGDTPAADGGVERVGGTAVLLDDTTLAAFAERERVA